MSRVIRKKDQIKEMLEVLDVEKRGIKSFMEGFDVELLNDYDKILVDQKSFMVCNSKIGVCISIDIDI